MKYACAYIHFCEAGSDLWAGLAGRSLIYDTQRLRPDLARRVPVEAYRRIGQSALYPQTALGGLNATVTVGSPQAAR